MIVHVLIDDTIKSDDRVSMVLFHGTVESDFFNGNILPGGVDTQIVEDDGHWTLSARYIIDGTDKDGTPTRIFVQNDGYMENDRVVTKPRFITANLKLKFLETNSFTGSLEGAPGGVTITITQD